MGLAPGKTLGQYEIVSPLGAGGMGEVYRARDTKLGREVAIKLLREEVYGDPERFARFEREARVLASLNHGNIATLYGFETEGQTSFLVMELVEGETLADRISRGPLPVGEAIQLFLQIAEGLEAAHEIGVVHRDLKPANIKLTEEGPGTPTRAKILDFGLAKGLAQEKSAASSSTDGRPASESPTLTYMATQRGEILGTVAYMSPEQARGKRIDRRTDVWAFGACLYEALTGATAFQGETATDVMAHVVTRAPDWDALPAATPHRLQQLLARCLERDPRRRLRDIGEAWVELDRLASDDGEPSETATTAPSGPSLSPPASGVGLASRLAWLAAGVVIGALAVWALIQPPPDPPEPVRRFAIDLGPSLPFPVIGVSSMIALSSDGQALAVSVNRTGVPLLHVRRLDRLTLDPIEGTEFAYTPFFSPDGEWIGFHEPGSRKLKKVPVKGGPVQTLCDAYPPLGGVWLEDGTVIFSSQGTKASALFRVASSGGEPVPVTKPGELEDQVFPVALPGDRGVLFTGGSTATPQRGSFVALLDPDTGETRRLVEDAGHAYYVSSGHLLFVRGSALWAVPFDLDALTVSGHEFVVQAGVGGNLFYTPLAVSPPGLLVYSALAESAVGGSHRLVWLDRQGGEESIAAEADSFGDVRISHDGSKLAVLVNSSQEVGSDLWIYDLGGRPPIRVTSGQVVTSPVWTPDDTRITFLDHRAAHVRTVPIDGNAQIREVVNVQLGGIGQPRGWTPDGRDLLVDLPGGAGGQGVHTIVVSESGEQRLLMETDFHVTGIDLSPDGAWVAYLSNTTGAFELYVRDYAGSGPQYRVSADGAQKVRWSRDGRELLFASSGLMMAATFDPGQEPRIGPPVELFSRRTVFWDVGPDGRILAVLPVDPDAPANPLVVVDGFLAELARLAQAGGA